MKYYDYSSGNNYRNIYKYLIPKLLIKKIIYN